jgi:hypothetical protein
MRKQRRSGINGSVTIGRRCEDVSEEDVDVAVEVEVEEAAVEEKEECARAEEVAGIQRVWKSGGSGWNHRRSQCRRMRRRSR